MKTTRPIPRRRPAAQSAGFPTALRRFGKWGPVYQPCKMVKPGIVQIRVLETGEKAEYPLAHLLKDPEAV